MATFFLDLTYTTSYLDLTCPSMVVKTDLIDFDLARII